MKGLELSKQYYLEHGKPMLERSFSEILPFIAVGLVGSGSECLGFDDDISKDHDFEPAFCIFLPSESIVDRKTEFALERAYSKLPNEFLGFHKAPLSPVGGNRHGIIRIEDFFTKTTGSPSGELDAFDWLSIDEQALLEATSGEVFFDGLGQFSAIREKISYFPEDIRLKKLAGHLLNMAQSGRYNYQRCILRQEYAAAQLAIFEFVKSALHVIFMLNKRYVPYYKWSFRALRELNVLSSLHEVLEFLISNDNKAENIKTKEKIIETICQEIISILHANNLIAHSTKELESCAYEINDRIIQENIRNMHILCAI